MTDEELQMSLFSGQGRGGDEAKRSWMGVVYIMLILTLHISGIKHNSQLQTFKSNHYRIPILLLFSLVECIDDWCDSSHNSELN